ncbi:glycosyltransferase family 4 protein [Thermodesulfobacteriota bacterium]
MIDTPSIQEQNLVPKGSYRIAFIIHGMVRYSGGHTSMLRLGSYLHRFGNEVSYITIDESRKNSMEKNAAKNLPSFQGVFQEKDILRNRRFDIGIATHWLTAYYLLAYQRQFDYKMYFVQDFEPYFYPMGDLYLLAQNTYKLGLHMVSLGPWNKTKIEETISEGRTDVVDFPVAIDQYEIHDRKISVDNEIRLAVYVKSKSKRAPTLIFEQLKYLNGKLSALGYRLKIYVFGMETHMIERLPMGIKLGRLSHQRLMQVYKTCHFGLVASLTNISLVNYEMIASGLPVIDYCEGSAPSFFKKDEMIFIESSISSLYEKVVYYVKNQGELNEMLKRAQKKILKNQLDWEKTARSFADLLSNPIRQP